MPIRDLADLRGHLQTALEIEHATVPPYLCAMYTLHPQTNEDAYYIIRSVVAEEMLHMVLVANVLNAVGGSPSVNHPGFVPEYPTFLPHSAGTVCVQLLKFSHEAIATFIEIERPARPDAPPEPDSWHTLAQFYQAIREGLCLLVGRMGPDAVFTGSHAFQISGGWYYGGGEAFPVHDLCSALKALDVVVDQGEGIDHRIWDGDDRLFGESKEVAHYFRFNEIRRERKYGPHDTPKTGPTGPLLRVAWDSVYNMRPNPKLSDLAPGELRDGTQRFNELYAGLLDQIHRAFNGHPELLLRSVGSMFELTYLAGQLIRNPGDDGWHAGPTFELPPP